MPSHSKKQHNFMEAIAHSPSFAKKAGVPQSVGKDYAAADKGKTFSKGGEMKESKGMVGKEVAFFKKKGAPKSMIKHEEAEIKGMKRGGRVRRMAGGGMGDDVDMSMGYSDPFAKPRDYDKEKAQGADNLKRIKGFFGFGDSSDEGERKPTGEQSKTVTPAAAKPSWAGSGDSDSAKKTYPLPRNRTLPDIKNPESDDNERKFRGPQFANSVSDRGEGELSGDGLSPAQGPKAQPKRRPAMAGKPIGVEKTVKKERVITEPSTEPSEKTSTGATFKSDLEGRLDQMKTPRKFGLASDETRDSVRKGLGKFADFFNLGKRHEQEFGKKAAKGGQVKKMAFGGDTGQPMRGAAPMKPAMQRPRVPLLDTNKPGMSDLAKQKMGSYNQGMLDRIAASKVKAMAEGGFARADGIAKKGKTEGKMVKMAAGGFVRSADGCAQRGKTKATQVKMSRGGKC